jgi:hypothetical protein
MKTRMNQLFGAARIGMISGLVALASLGLVTQRSGVGDLT